MQHHGYSTLKGPRVGVLGGLAGTVVLSVFSGLAATGTGQEVIYVTIAGRLCLGDAAVVGGWALHLFTGVVAGAVFVGTTGRVKGIALITTRRVLWVGVLGGAAVWLVVDVPVTGALLPEYLTSPMLAMGSFVLHIVYGIVTAFVSRLLLRPGPLAATPA